MKTSRVKAIDALRGFSLLGILLANMLIFQYGIWGKDELQYYSVSPNDKVFYYVIKIFVESSFMPIFTFLFGYSMIKMNESLQMKGMKIKRTFIKRAIILVVLGFLHSEFLWEGDILLFYGCMMIFLLMFLNRKPKTLLIWGMLLLFLTSLIGYGGVIEETPSEKNQMKEYVLQTIDVYGNGSYSEIRHHRITEMPLDLSDELFFIIVLLMPIFSASLFLIGMYAAKRNWFMNLEREKIYYCVGASVLLPIGIIFKSVYLFVPDGSWSGVMGMLGGNLLALGYICLFALLYTITQNYKLVKKFEDIGVLSLSNYLLQTIIFTFIFYGYGLGQFGKLGLINASLIALGVFTLQLYVSSWYLKYFKMGPVEKVLRFGTNITLKRKKDHNHENSVQL
ncbi:DUF418 domain-containing protein [Metabacillus litoralis]|nr:DUF418 domain-containing protein [Metabacillus litoralis]